MKFYANVSFGGGYGAHIEAKSHEEAYSALIKYTKEKYCKCPSNTSIELKEIKDNTKEPVER